MTVEQIREVIRLVNNYGEASTENTVCRLIVDGELDIIKLPYFVRRMNYDLFYGYAFRRTGSIAQHEYFQQLEMLLEEDVTKEQEVLKHLVNTFEEYRNAFDPGESSENCSKASQMRIPSSKID